MADFDFQIRKFSPEECRRLLARLPGIFAAGMRMEGEMPVEVHILASTERNPKQIARDVQSALFAAYGTEVDHRIISIAQLPDDPFLAPEQLPGDAASAARELMPEKEVRLLFAGIDSRLQAGRYSIQVRLSYEGKIYSGEADCRDTTIQRNRSVAQATINAVHAFLGLEPFSLLEVKHVSVCGETIAVTVIEDTEKENPQILIGAAAQPENASVGIVRSTLDGLNRSISRLHLH